MKTLANNPQAQAVVTKITERDLPPWTRLPLYWMRQRWHRVVVDEDRYEPDNFKFFVKVMRDEEADTWSHREVYLRDGITFTRSLFGGKLGPTIKVRDLVRKPDAPTPEARIRRKARNRPISEYRDYNRYPTMQSLFVQRAEVVDEIRQVELRFTRFPDWDDLAHLGVLRQALSALEERIVVAREEAEEDAAF